MAHSAWRPPCFVLNRKHREVAGRASASVVAPHCGTEIASNQLARWGPPPLQDMLLRACPSMQRAPATEDRDLRQPRLQAGRSLQEAAAGQLQERLQEALPQGMVRCMHESGPDSAMKQGLKGAVIGAATRGQPATSTSLHPESLILFNFSG